MVAGSVCRVGLQNEEIFVDSVLVGRADVQREAPSCAIQQGVLLLDGAVADDE